MPTSLRLVRKKPCAKLIEMARDMLTEDYFSNFAGHIETARAIWRKYPHLVEAPNFPEPYYSAFVKHNGFQPNDGTCPYGDDMERDSKKFAARLKKEAHNLADAWANNHVGRELLEGTRHI